MNDRRRATRFGAILVAGSLVVGCATPIRDNFFRQPMIPPDFSFAMTTTGAEDSTAALDFHTDRLGRATWRTWNRVTRVETNHGEAEVTEAQLDSLWFAAVDAKFGRIDAGSPPADYGAGSTSAVQRIALTARGVERVVWRPPGAADVAPIRKAVLDLVPRDVAAAFTSR